MLLYVISSKHLQRVVVDNDAVDTKNLLLHSVLQHFSDRSLIPAVVLGVPSDFRKAVRRTAIHTGCSFVCVASPDICSIQSKYMNQQI